MLLKAVEDVGNGEERYGSEDDLSLMGDAIAHIWLPAKDATLHDVRHIYNSKVRLFFN